MHAQRLQFMAHLNEAHPSAIRQAGKQELSSEWSQPTEDSMSSGAHLH